MSIRSYCHYEASWPRDTPIDAVWLPRAPEDLGDILYVEEDVYDAYSDHILDGLIEAFVRSLDEVHGLELHLAYSCEVDGYFECRIDIMGGKVTYEESEIVFVERPLDDCCIGIRR